MVKIMFDINNKEISVGDSIYYATTHGNMQKGRVLAITEDGYLKVIGKGNRRELTIKDSSTQVLINAKGYYLRVKKLKA